MVRELKSYGSAGLPSNAMITKTALGAEERVIWEHCEDALFVIRKLKSEGYKIVLLEQMHNSIPYQHFIPQAPICLVLGNEISGVSDELLELCDCAIEIEMRGVKNSLNVSVAFGVVAYHLANAMDRLKEKS
jgi:tRNA G18 (ribose-2'-O)-methylase SpoU